MIPKYWFALFCTLLLPIACVGTKVQHTTVRPADHAPPTSVIAFDCADGQAITVRLENRSATLMLGENTLRLDQVPAASGAKYSNGSATFWTQGREAILVLPGQAETTCTLQKEKSVWEAARLRGIDFRAVGNEPGWYLEMAFGKRILVVTDYGNQRHSFPAPAEPPDPDAAQTTIRARTSEHKLEVVINNKPCRDSMSGERFETTVRATLDGRTFNGCGRSLP
jgi:putative lipoprotein